MDRDAFGCLLLSLFVPAVVTASIIGSDSGKHVGWHWLHAQLHGYSSCQSLQLNSVKFTTVASCSSGSSGTQGSLQTTEGALATCSFQLSWLLDLVPFKSNNYS